MNTYNNTKFLIKAAERGDAAEVQRLIPISDPKANDSYALRLTAQDGHTECVKLLIPFSDPHAGEYQALHNAALSGHVECIKLLIPVSDPKFNNSQFLQAVVFNNQQDCVDALFDVSDPFVALHHIQKEFPHHPKTWQYLEQKIVNQQKNTLQQEITTDFNRGS